MKKTLLCAIFLQLTCFIFAQNLTPFQDSESKKWGYRTGKGATIEPIFDAVGSFYKDYAWIKTGKDWGIIFRDQTQYIVEPQFRDLKRLDDHTFWVKDKQKMWGVMNYDGTWIQACQYQSLAFWETYLHPKNMMYKVPLSDWDTVLFQKNDSLGLMNRKGEVLKKLPYNHVVPFEDTPNFTVVCMLDAQGFGIKWGMIDKYGQEIIPCIYDDLGNHWGEPGFDNKSRRLNSPTIFVKLGDACGYYNFAGEMIVPLTKCK